MIARTVPFTPAMRDAEGRKMGTGRGAGVHLGDILNWRQEMLDRAPNKTGNDWFAQVGFLFERILSLALAAFLGSDDDALISPGEMQVDGIFMNPDRFHTEQEAVWEVKVTWRSMKKMFHPDGELNVGEFEKWFYRWIWQIASYCHAMGATKARLVVLFINGSYTYTAPHGGPQFRAVDLEFTEEELELHWQAILRDRDEMLAAA